MRRAASIAMVTVLTVVIGAAGALGAAYVVRPATHLAGGVVSPSPSPPPSPTPLEPPVNLPGTAQLVAPSSNVVWVLMNYQALFASSDQGNTWEERLVPSPPGGIRPLISFVNDREGWLLAPGVPATQCEDAAADIWHTTDGAATWQRSSIAGIDLGQCKDGIWFVDPQHGFVAAQDPNHRPTVYRTSDGGDSWAGTTLSDPPSFQTIGAGISLHVDWVKAFGRTLYLEASDGQLESSQQYVYTSSDGGATWRWLTKVPSRDVVMVTETRWLVLTTQRVETTTGGQQWHPFTTDLNLDTPVLGGTQFVFADAQVGYETGRGLLQRTKDGGAHWVRIETSGISTSPSPTPSPIVMPSTAQLSAPSTKVVWALVAGQHLFVSTDQAATWQPRTLPPVTGNPLISFVDDRAGFALYKADAAPDCSAQNADLWFTTDGAKTWQLMNGTWSHQCKDAIYFSDASHGFLATGDSFNVATIWVTADGGHTWFAVPNAANRPAPRVFSFHAYGDTVLAYAPPFVYRSTDGGQTWSYVTQSPKSSKSIGFVTASRWIELISPADSSETTDAGASWHTLNTDYSQAAPIAPQLVFADASVGYATVRGEVQRTLNGGAHWEMIKSSWP